jgi:hypothetical protein
MAEGKEGGLPVHDPSVCVWKAGRWECLHAVDADHFWYGDVLVDLNQLRHEASRVVGADKVHSTSSAMGHLVNTNWLMRNRPFTDSDLRVVRSSLYGLNQAGLHTGVVFKD